MREVDDGYELWWRDCSVLREAPPVPLYNRPGPGCPRSVTWRSPGLILTILSLRCNPFLVLACMGGCVHRVLLGLFIFLVEDLSRVGFIVRPS